MAGPFTRFSGLLPVAEIGKRSVLLIGAGGIGLPAAVALAKTGVQLLTVFDFDQVSEENTGTQMYGPGQIGRPKVLCLKDTLAKQAPWCPVTAYNERFTTVTAAGYHEFDIVVTAVDSMNARREIWSAVRNKCRLLVDPRMGAEVLTMRSVAPGDEAWYERSLEGDAEPLPCTAKATFYTGLVAGGLVAQAVRSHVADERTYAEFTLDMRNLVCVSQTPAQLHAAVRRVA